MDNKKIKKIMTDLAAGHISKKQADVLINEEKVEPEAPVQEIEGEDVPGCIGDVPKTQKRKLNANNKILKNRETSV